MKENDQHEAMLAFWIAMLMQLFGLLFPSDGRTILLRVWWEDMLGSIGRPISVIFLFEVFYIGANALWLISPFITRVYGQLAPVRKLAMVMSLSATAATCFWFYVAVSRKPCVYAILLAAVAHTAGMFLIRKEHPRQA